MENVHQEYLRENYDQVQEQINSKNLTTATNAQVEQIYLVLEEAFKRIKYNADKEQIAKDNKPYYAFHLTTLNEMERLTSSGSKIFPKNTDTDGDGIVDSADACPTVMGNIRYHGCPPSDKDGTYREIKKEVTNNC